MLKFENVSIKRGNALILENINLSVDAGNKIAICGPSGSGKSSLLMAAMGCFPVSHGQILFEDKALSKLNFKEIRQHIAYIGQDSIMGAENILDSILLPFNFKSNHTIKPDTDSISKLLIKLGLKQNILEMDCIKVSGGERQRIAIVRALLMKKKLFLVDEVTTGLDPESRKYVIDLFQESKFTVLSVSHDMEWLKKQNYIYEFKNKNIYKYKHINQ
ncbi:MAG TPA: ABC transporter ATP-binding protein [Victivallales bacterium]|nr:ABC transporter ATP-binding protein [Victivallales bacterium]